jgi:hypothetical protein
MLKCTVSSLLPGAMSWWVAILCSELEAFLLIRMPDQVACSPRRMPLNDVHLVQMVCACAQGSWAA